MMNYIYKSAWAVIGGINLPQDKQSIELYRSEQCRFVLTKSPDNLLADIDRESAVRRLMLKGLIGQAGDADFAVALETEVDEIKAERAKNVGTKTVLVIEANGEINSVVTEPFKEHEGFIVTFDAVNKQCVARIHQSEIQAMKLAVALESETPSRFASLAEGTYLTNEAGKIVYSISFTMLGADLAMSRGLSAEGADSISERYAMLQRMGDLESVERLFSQMSNDGTDRLKVFLSGWAALEILIAKAFKTYEHAFFLPLANAGQPIRERFLNRIKEVMKDKYRLTDKFLAVASIVFPDDQDKEIEEDFKQFSKLKKLRDSISHGDEFTERDLPVHELTKLLRKYILAYVATPIQTSVKYIGD